MKKKTLSVILSLVLLFSCALLPVSATAFVDLDNPEATWSDSSCLRLMAPVHANNPINLPLGTTISESCTVTWYLKPDVSDVLQTFNFYLSSTYLDGNINNTDAANSWLTGISFGRETGGLKAIPYCNKFFFNLQGLGGQYCGYGNTLDEPNLYWYESGVTHADVSMTAGQWNRIDLSVDMENRVTDVYLNYKKIGSGKFFSGELAEFNALYAIAAAGTDSKTGNITWQCTCSIEGSDMEETIIADTKAAAKQAAAYCMILRLVQEEAATGME